jgi:ABC-type cobalt transport system substrate-binding protein
MYTANKRQKKHKIFLRFILIVVPIIILLGILVWYVFFRDNSNSASFSKAGAEVAVVKPVYKDFTNQFFKISMPSSWADLGRKNPYSNQVYYEFQNTQKDYDNRWLRVYVDVFPADFAINRLMPITVVNNKIIPDVVSDTCDTFTGAPISGNNRQQASETWAAKYKDINFICDMGNPRNYVGTASSAQGYATTLTNKDGSTHKYFFVYIDHNIHPEYSVFSDTLKSFETQ